MASPLEDLDELTLRCRNEKARLYIGEAVASYRAGAFRSSIVASWIAVCFDVIEKIRELALAGDKEAEKHVTTLAIIQKSNDLQHALRFEKDLLTIAKEKFELISALEYIDLDRLQHDRNRCAHPSLTIDDQAYAPSAELARLHLHSAVTHLLQHPPAQGKYALERLLNDVESEYFPTESEKARIAFASGPLKRPRESLVRNFVLVLTKTLLNDKPNYKRRIRIECALAATATLHHKAFTKTLTENLSLLIRAVPDTELNYSVSFLRRVNDTWQYLEPDVKQRIEIYVTNLPSTEFDDLELLLEYPPLKEQAKKRSKSATLVEISDAFFIELPPPVADRLIDIYLSSSSFESANLCAKQLIKHSNDFNSDHIKRLLANIKNRRVVRDSFQLKSLISSLKSNKKINDEEFIQLLKEHSLDEFLLEDL